MPTSSTSSAYNWDEMRCGETPGLGPSTVCAVAYGLRSRVLAEVSPGLALTAPVVMDIRVPNGPVTSGLRPASGLAHKHP